MSISAKVSFPVLLFANPGMLLNFLKFFEPRFTDFLNGDNGDCFMDNEEN